MTKHTLSLDLPKTNMHKMPFPVTIPVEKCLEINFHRINKSSSWKTISWVSDRHQMKETLCIVFTMEFHHKTVPVICSVLNIEKLSKCCHNAHDKMQSNPAITSYKIKPITLLRTLPGKTYFFLYFPYPVSTWHEATFGTDQKWFFKTFGQYQRWSL